MVFISRNRSISAQLNHAVSESFVYGSKRAARMDLYQKADCKVYSTERAEALHKLSSRFGKFMKAEFPDVKMAKDIKREHVQSYLSRNESRWSKRTSEEYCSLFRKLEKIVQTQYSRKASFASDLVAKQIDSSDYRNKAMSREDYLNLIDSFGRADSTGRIGLELAYRFGLRSCECVGLRAEEIDLKNKVLHLGGYCKNGKHRDVPIREKDFDFIRDVKEMVGRGRVCPVKEESLNRGVRYHLKKLGLDDKYQKTTIHAVRKLYATERMIELRGDIKKDPAVSDVERRAWSIVQTELGHGSRFRMELYSTYVKD